MQKKFLRISIFCLGLAGITWSNITQAPCLPFGSFDIDDKSGNDGAACITPKYRIWVDGERITAMGCDTFGGLGPTPGRGGWELDAASNQARKATARVRVEREYGLVNTYKRAYEGPLGFATNRDQRVTIELRDTGLSVRSGR